jgi:hypothetical protein
MNDSVSTVLGALLTKMDSPTSPQAFSDLTKARVRPKLMRNCKTVYDYCHKSCVIIWVYSGWNEDKSQKRVLEKPLKDVFRNIGDGFGI